jgi:hypothetical protein
MHHLLGTQRPTSPLPTDHLPLRLPHHLLLTLMRPISIILTVNVVVIRYRCALRLGGVDAGGRVRRGGRTEVHGEVLADVVAGGVVAL